MTPATIVDIVRLHGRARPDDTAFVFGDRVVTYRDLDDASSRVANGLRDAGVGAQDRVAFLDKNSVEYFEVLFGAAKINAVMVAVNWRLAPAEAAYIVNDAEAKVLVVSEDLAPVLDAMVSELTTTKKIVVIGRHDEHPAYADWLAEQSPDDPGVTATADDVALQLYSSGTTGLPKGVMLTNTNCVAFIHAMGAGFGIHDRAVGLVAMPLFHVAGGLWALIPLYHGLRSVLEREIDPRRLVDQIVTHGVTHAVIVPAVLQFMVSIPGVDDADFSRLEYMGYGASPISETVLRTAMRVFGCKFFQAYGMTETAATIVALLPEDHDPDGPLAHRLRAAGRPIADYRLRIVDPETLEDLPTGQVGEVLVQSAQNMKGYWKLPEETARTLLPDGWLRTGDAGYLDADGYLYIHDRVKDMIISGAENVYPAEVENALMAHPDVADVAVIGVPSDKWGETPKAMVVRRPGATVTEEELLAFARERLAHYKCPTSIDWLDALPRNPSGKVLKKDLRAPFWEGRTRQVN